MTLLVIIKWIGGLQECGHNCFCFPCVQGLKACPICKQHINGWEPLQPISTVSPLLLSLGGAEDIELDALLAKPVVVKKRKGDATSPILEEIRVSTVQLDAEEDGGNMSDDSSGGRTGWVEYCDDETFRQGGSRTVSITTAIDLCNDEGTEEEQPTKEANFGVFNDGPNPRLKRSRAGKTMKALKEICGAPIAPAVKDKRVGVGLQSTTEVVSIRKKVGRPSAASKAHKIAAKEDLRTLRSTTPQSVIPPRSTPRPRLTVPAKFRDLL